MSNLPISLYIKNFGRLDTTLPIKPCIYAIICRPTGKFYIGSAVNGSNRFSKHLLAFKQSKHHSSYLQRAFSKYGANSFDFSVLELVDDKNKLIKREQFYLDTFKPEFNMNPIAGSNLGRKFSLETRMKIRAANLGKKLSPRCRAIAIKNLRPPEKGFHHSVETRLKMSATRKLNPPMGMKGKKHSLESRQKIAEAGAKTYHFLSPEKELVTVTNAAAFCRDNGLIKFHLYAVHTGKRKSHKGWTKFIDIDGVRI